MHRIVNLSDHGRRSPSGFYSFAQRAATLVAMLGAGVAVMGAQTPVAATTQTGLQQNSAQVRPLVDFKVPAGGALFSTSASEDDASSEASVVSPLPDFAGMVPYAGGRQQANRARYRSGFTNDDGSNKLMGYVGAGAGVPVGWTDKYWTPGYAIQAGGGWQFSKKFAVPIEFDFDHFGLTSGNLQNQTTVYDKLFGKGAVRGILDGGSHVMSLSIDPTYSFRTNDALGAYVVGGVGFYHKITDFNVPSLASFCGGGYGVGGYGYGYGGFGYGGYGYGGCGTYVANQSIDKYTSNAPGFNGGVGVTYRFSRFSHEQLYAEMRYVFVDDSYRPGITIYNDNTITATTTNFYPANSEHTGYFPFKVGIRF